MRIWGLEIRRRSDLTDDSDTPALRKRVQRLEIALTELEEAHAALAGAHMKLRNQFHGSKGGRPRGDDSTPDAIPHGDKDALRRAAGIRPVAITPRG